MCFKKWGKTMMEKLMADPTGTGGMIVVIIALIKIVELLIKKVIPINKNSSSSKKEAGLTTEEHSWLSELYVLHSQKDQYGVPRVYVPRECGESKQELVKSLTQLSNTQEKTAFILESLVRQIEHLANRLDK